MEIPKSPYRPLRFGLVCYDFLRLLLMLELLISVIPLGTSPEASWFPYLVYAVPNALFPLMGFFLLISPGEYKTYISLYMAGKFIVIVSILVWGFFSLSKVFTSILSLPALIAPLGLVFCLIILDAVSILVSSTLKNKLYGESMPEGEGEPEELREEIPEERGLL
jgi:hypothetical protein